MARTRGASSAFGVAHLDDGELLDKEGKPIPTGAGAPKLQHMDDGEIVLPAPKAAPPPVSVTAASAYRCDRTTWARDMQAVEALLLLELFLGDELTATVKPEVWAKLHPDVRRHFRRVMEPAE
jgi:hypothetical protein